MADRVHQVRLAHAHAAIHEQRVVGLGWSLRHSLRRGAGELVAIADHESIERIARVQLRRTVPVEALLGKIVWTCSILLCVWPRVQKAILPRRRRAMAPVLTAITFRRSSWRISRSIPGPVRGRRIAAIVARADHRRVFLGRHKLHFVEIQLQRLERFVDQVCVTVDGPLTFHCRDAHHQHALTYVAVHRGLQPLVERLTIGFLFESRQDANPWIDDWHRRWYIRHRLPCASDFSGYIQP